MARLILLTLAIAFSACPAEAGAAFTINDSGDAVYHARRSPVVGLETLPDDASPEQPPAEAEALPVFAGKAGEVELPPGGIDPANVIPADLKAAALAYYSANSASFGNVSFLGIIDFARHSSERRFHIVDLRSGAVRSLHMAHGQGSDPDNDGYATVFSNRDSSHASSLGFYLTGATYYGENGRSLRLHGLSDTNSNAFERAVVIHPANYVQDREVQQGRSWGCPAISRASAAYVIDSLRNGALIYAGVSASGR